MAVNIVWRLPQDDSDRKIAKPFLFPFLGNASNKKEDAMPEYLDAMWTAAVESRALPMNERIDRTLQESRPRIEPRRVSVIIDDSTIARLNSNGVWNAYDLTGKLAGENYTSDIPNPIFTTVDDLKPLRNTCLHGMPRSSYCTDCGR